MNIEKLATFDIETAGGWATLDDLKKDNPKLAELWSKRCEFLRDRYVNNKDLSEDELWILKSGLHAEFGRVVCISFGIYKNNEIVMRSCCSSDEREVLEWTSKMMDNVDKLGMNIAGHTIERFDIPFLWKRFLANGMKPPYLISSYNKKPWDLTHFDVAKFWSGGAWQEGFTSLDTLATLFGLPSPKESGVIASEVHTMFWDNKDLQKIQTYCEGDVQATVNVTNKLLTALI